MQKPSSDRLVTTHHATYIAPGLMPGYRGHCPGQKFDYGQTYGAFTAKQLQDYRSTVLQSSLTPYSKGGYYATYFSHDPDIVLNNRKTGRERYKDRFQCELYNHDFDRSEEIKRFDLVSFEQTTPNRIYDLLIRCIKNSSYRDFNVLVHIRLESNNVSDPTYTREIGESIVRSNYSQLKQTEIKTA
ncbi:hypothetical protein FGIG_03891 [Fasciola gigantica]|uniref:Ciliary microtubule inner protein 2C n=1 Tax=Fasciola gigantica TaxID=46835 RepID=A0A504Z4M2_FASGI|nr:hypothetical protein FGIG_03891 [Fasciola gigantica]